MDFAHLHLLAAAGKVSKVPPTRRCTVPIKGCCLPEKTFGYVYMVYIVFNMYYMPMSRFAVCSCDHTQQGTHAETSSLLWH